VTHLGLNAAMAALDQALDSPRRPGVPLGNWRWVVRQRCAVVREELLGERAGSADGWLAARGGAAFRERNALVTRVGELSTQVLESEDVESTRIELKRLLVDVSRHVQRLNDLAYDEVEMEIGGSE
jgi:hypothetical protein